MIEVPILPRFKDTDALGHINNASVSTWYEEGRRPFFEFFIPDLDPKKWNLIIARSEIDFIAQAYYNKPVTIQTSVEKIGNSSFVLYQEAIQDGTLVGRNKAFLVHFDYTTQKSVIIPDHIREKLSQHLKA